MYILIHLFVFGWVAFIFVYHFIFLPNFLVIFHLLIFYLLLAATPLQSLGLVRSFGTQRQTDILLLYYKDYACLILDLMLRPMIYCLMDIFQDLNKNTLKHNFALHMLLKFCYFKFKKYIEIQICLNEIILFIT